jgi:hypothetical protein
MEISEEGNFRSECVVSVFPVFPFFRTAPRHSARALCTKAESFVVFFPRSFFLPLNEKGPFVACPPQRDESMQLKGELECP